MSITQQFNYIVCQLHSSSKKSSWITQSVNYTVCQLHSSRITQYVKKKQLDYIVCQLHSLSITQQQNYIVADLHSLYITQQLQLWYYIGKSFPKRIGTLTPPNPRQYNVNPAKSSYTVQILNTKAICQLHTSNGLAQDWPRIGMHWQISCQSQTIGGQMCI